MQFLDTVSTQCQRKVIALSIPCAGWYFIPAWMFDRLASLNPKTELSVTLAADWQFVHAEIAKGFHELSLGPDIGVSVIGRWILAFMMFPLGIVIAIHTYYIVKQFFSGGGPPKPPSGKYEGIMVGIKRMRGG